MSMSPLSLVPRLHRAALFRMSTVRLFSSPPPRSNRPLFSSYLITPADLSSALASKPSDLIPLSAAWFLPNASTTGIASFTKSHIPGSRFFDLDAISDTSSPYPHMLPSPSQFDSHMSNLGISPLDTIVVYDTPELGLFSAPRVAWTFRAFGHKGGVHVLNNYKLWVEAGMPTISGAPEAVERKDYAGAALDGSMVRSYADVRALVQSNIASGGVEGEVMILDARSKGRFDGVDPEPRPGLSSGAMPGARNVPIAELLDGSTKAMLDGEALREWFVKHGVDGSKEVVASCGTGVTAAVVEAALREAGLGEGRVRIYDGSWTEWAQRVGGEEGFIVKQR